MSNPIVDFSKQTKGLTITNTDVLGVVGVPLSIGGDFTAIAQPFGTGGTAFYVTITGHDYKFSKVYDTANQTVKIGGVDVSGNSATAICTQLRDEVLFSDANSVTGLITGNYYRYNTYTKELETFLPITKGYDGTTITTGNESTYIDGVIFVKVGSLYYKKLFYGAPNVQWFGAKGDWDGTTGTDNATAFQAAITLAGKMQAGKIYIPTAGGERYDVQSASVNILYRNFEIQGDAPAQNLGTGNPAQTDYLGRRAYITSSTGLAAIFDFGGSNAGLTPVATGHITVTNVSFYKSGTFNASAVKISHNNDGPHRGITFQNVSGVGFTDAIYLDATGTPSVVGGTVQFINCNFNGCTRSVNTIETSFGLVFTGNQAEAGASIAGKFDAGVLITDNILESNKNTVNIDANAPIVTVERNYFEANSGEYVVRAKGTNINASLEFGDNYGLTSCPNVLDWYVASSVMRVKFKAAFHYSTRSSPLTVESGSILPLGTDLKGMGFYVPTTISMSAALVANQYSNTVPVGAVTAVNQNLGAVTLATPFGVTSTGLSVTGTYSSSNDKVLSLSYATTDQVVFTALVKVTGAANDKLSFKLKNQSGTDVRSVSELRIPSSHEGQWVLVTGVFNPSVAGTNLKVGFEPNLDDVATSTMNVAAIGAYVVPAGEKTTFTYTTSAGVAGTTAVRVMCRPFVPFTYAAPALTGISDRKYSTVYLNNALGGTMKGETTRARKAEMTTAGSTPTSQFVQYQMIEVPADGTLSSVSFWQVQQGVYTASNTNEIALCTLTGGNFVKVATTGDLPNLWKGTANTEQTNNFTTPYVATAGIYFIAFIYSTSAQTTAPTIGAAATGPTGSATLKDCTGISTQTSVSSSQAVSGTTSNASRLWFKVD